MAQNPRPASPPRPAGTPHHRPGPGRDRPRELLWRRVVGDRLRAVRHERGETLDDTAARAGVSPQYLSEVERGLKEPSSEVIAAVTGALDLTLADLTLAVAETLSGNRSRTGSVAGPTCRAQLALAA